MSERKLGQWFGRGMLRYTVSLALLVSVWEAAARLGDIPSYILPPPTRVSLTLSEEPGLFGKAAWFTIQNMLIGGGLGMGTGILVGGFVAYFRPARWLVEPYLVIFQSFPRESLAPLFIIWLGFGAGSKILSAAMLSFFPVAVIVLNGLLDTRKEYLDLFASWGASRWQEFVYCRLPAMIPGLVSAVKLAVPLALIGSVLGEFMGGNDGLGYLIMTSGSVFRMDRVFASVGCLAGIGLVSATVINAVQYLLLRKYYQD